ncbi:glycoside hydrolase family protein [Streptomyces peucetius]|nr:hypothetical protein CGZ69_02130 [Streptomyces peucetius subsp. caesius ATCC 27952]
MLRTRRGTVSPRVVEGDPGVCAGPADHSAARLARPGVTAEGGTRYLEALAKPGRYSLTTDAFLVGRPRTRYYVAGSWSTRDVTTSSPGEQFDADRNFVGRLSDPMPVTLAGADHALSVELPQ